MTVYVYVAGPYSKGDQVLNVRAAVDASNALMFEGFVPFLPHLTMLWHLITPKSYPEWLAYDALWLARCDAVLRLPGESEGADREVDLARSMGLPVFFEVAELVADRMAGA